jgi:hypothetical protein
MYRLSSAKWVSSLHNLRLGLVHKTAEVQVSGGDSMKDVWPRLGDWHTRGKSIRNLIEELKRFENQDEEVNISIDGGETVYPISMAMRKDMKCVLSFHNPKN